MLAPGDRIDRYELLARVGAGGQASVWKARDTTSGRVVGLKVMSLSGDRAQDERAAREARVLESLTHPSLVRGYHSFQDARRHVIGLALEWVDGTTLDRANQDARWSTLHLHAALCHVASALARLHEAGVVHRDIKGSNVLVSEAFFADPLDPGAVKLADLGIASGVGNPQALTNVGYLVGTTRYLPPEALRARGRQDSRPARDVFAVGVMGWLLKHGSHPTGLPGDATIDEFAEAYAAYAGAEALWLPPRDEDDPLTRALRSCLRLDESARPTDGAALLRALPPLPRRPVQKTTADLAPTQPHGPPRELTSPAGPLPFGATGREPIEAPQRPRRALVVFTGLAALVLVGVTAAALVLSLASEHDASASRARSQESEGRSKGEGGSESGEKRREEGARPEGSLSRRGAPRPSFAAATAPSGANGRHQTLPPCRLPGRGLPNAGELADAELAASPLVREAFDTAPCEMQVLGSDSHCALTHRIGRWLRLRFTLPAATTLTAVWIDEVAPPELMAEPWANGVDLYVAMPPRRVSLGISVPGRWDGPHVLLLDPDGAPALQGDGPCR